MAEDAGQVVVQFEAKLDGYNASVAEGMRRFQTSADSIQRSAAQVEGATTRMGAGASAGFQNIGASAVKAGGEVVQSSDKATKAALGLLNTLGEASADFSSGKSPLELLAKQGPDVIIALVEIAASGEKLGKVFKGIALPGVFALLTILPALIDKLFGSEKATDELSDSQSGLASHLDRTTGKVREQITYLQQLANLRDLAEKQQQGLDEYKGKRRNLISGLREPLAPTPVPMGEGIAMIPSSVSESGQKLLQTLANDYQGRKKNVQEVVVALNIAAKTDPTLRDAAKNVETLAFAVDTSARKVNGFRVELARQNVALGMATTAQKKLVAAHTEQHKSATDQIEDQVAYATATNEVERATIRLQRVRDRKPVVDLQGPAEKAQFEKDLTRETLALKAAEDAERNRISTHTGYSAATEIAADRTRDLAAAERELASTLRSLQGAFDPDVVAQKDYLERLNDIEKLVASGKLDPGTAFEYRWKAASEYSKVLAENAKKTSDEIYGWLKIDPNKEIAKITADMDKRGDAIVKAGNDKISTPGYQYIRSLDPTPEERKKQIDEKAIGYLKTFNDNLTKSAKSALHLHGILGDIVGDLIDMAIKQGLIKPLAGVLFGADGGGTSGGGGLLGKLAGALGGLFGGKGATIGSGNAGLVDTGARAVLDTGLGKITLPPLYNSASGNAFEIGGISGVDKNILSVNGIPLTRVSRGETAHIVPQARRLPQGAGRVMRPQAAVTVISAPQFDLSQAVTTPELLREVGRVSRENANTAAAAMGRSVMKAVPARVSQYQNDGS